MIAWFETTLIDLQEKLKQLKVQLFNAADKGRILTNKYTQKQIEELTKEQRKFMKVLSRGGKWQFQKNNNG